LNKVKSSLPNILTFFNLSLGVVAILMTVASDSKSSLIYASLLILLAALTDRLDGKVARKLGVSSEFGKELDSLSDLISFGVAPIIMAWKINLMLFGPASYLLVLIFPIAGAYRLARYNVSEFDNIFRGIPITVAGGVLSIANVYNAFQSMSGNHTLIHSISTLALIFLLSYLMVSNWNIKKV
jgi:CDP-diacylglycerol---serine O-phosphatidyltransferase